MTHRDIILLETAYTIPETVEKQMGAVLDAYDQLRDTLAEGKTVKADEAAEEMSKAVQAVPTEGLREEGREAWEQHAALYDRILREFQHVALLRQKRSYFAHITEVVYCTVKSFELGEKLSNVYYCPMAFDGKGAYWLSDSDTIINPYFGTEMKTCGELDEVLVE